MRPPVAEAARVAGTDFNLPEILAVVGDSGKVERTRNAVAQQAFSVGTGNLDGFTLGVAVGVPRRGAHTRDVGIERIPGVHMQVSEERLAIAIEMRAGGSRFSSFEGETRRAHENPSERIDNQSVENHCVPPGVDTPLGSFGSPNARSAMRFR